MHAVQCTHIAWHSCWADADVEVFTGLKAGRRRGRFFRYVGTSDVSHQGSTLHLTNGQSLGIVISNMLLLSTTACAQSSEWTDCEY